MLKIISPIDGSVYVKREYANTNEIENTLSNATEIVNEWKNTDLQIRKKLITKFVEVFLENKIEKTDIVITNGKIIEMNSSITNKN